MNMMSVNERCYVVCHKLGLPNILDAIMIETYDKGKHMCVYALNIRLGKEKKLYLWAPFISILSNVGNMVILW